MKSKIAMAVLGAALILPAVSFAANVDNNAVQAQSAKSYGQDNSQTRLIQESNGAGGVGG